MIHWKNGDWNFVRVNVKSKTNYFEISDLSCQQRSVTPEGKRLRFRSIHGIDVEVGNGTVSWYVCMHKNLTIFGWSHVQQNITS